MPDRELVARTLAVGWVLFWLLVMLQGLAAADDAHNLKLAQHCWREGTFSLADCGAVDGVIRRRAERAHISYEEMWRKYAGRAVNTPRGQLAAQLPDGDVPGWSERENARWAQLRERAGKVEDPCPGATHWGGLKISTDRERATRAVQAHRWAIVVCKQPTANTFFKEVR